MDGRDGEMAPPHRSGVTGSVTARATGDRGDEAPMGADGRDGETAPYRCGVALASVANGCTSEFAPCRHGAATPATAGCVCHCGAAAVVTGCCGEAHTSAISAEGRGDVTMPRGVEAKWHSCVAATAAGGRNVAASLRLRGVDDTATNCEVTPASGADGTTVGRGETIVRRCGRESARSLPVFVGEAAGPPTSHLQAWPVIVSA